MLFPSEMNPYWVSREKIHLTTAGIWTRDLQFTSPMLYQLSYKAKLGAGHGMMVWFCLICNPLTLEASHRCQYRENSLVSKYQTGLYYHFTACSQLGLIAQLVEHRTSKLKVTVSNLSHGQVELEVAIIFLTSIQVHNFTSSHYSY